MTADANSRVIATPWAEPAAEVAEALGTDTERGLAGAEAARRLGIYGPNRTERRGEVRFWHIFWEEVREPMILLLFAVAAGYFVFGELGEAVAVLVIITGIVFVEVWTEFRAKRAIAALDGLTEPAVRVVRGGEVTSVPAVDLVPGDIVLVRAGDRVPADLRLLIANDLTADESTLTGESFPQAKHTTPAPAGAPLAERRCMLFRGTVVTQGEGLGVVTATGVQTEMGQIVGLTLRARPPRTPLQEMMRELSRVLAHVALVAAGLIPLLLWGWGRLAPGEALLTGLSLAFATIPEELPILVSIVLGLGAWQLARRSALVRELRAAETVGHVTAVVTDKTGTLTENHLRLERLIPVNDLDAAVGLPALREAAWASAASDAGVAASYYFDPVDRAILEAPDRIGEAARGRWGRVVQHFPFSPERGWSGAIWQGPAGRVLVVKGTPERVLSMCAPGLPPAGPGSSTAQAGAPGVTAPGELARAVGTVASSLAALGYRVLGVAAGPVERDGEGKLQFLGLLAFADPVRPEVGPAVAAARRAGIKVWMATGDHPAAAGAVARQAGIEDDHVLTGAEIDQMTDEELAVRLGDGGICARISPAAKLRIVQVLQGRGEVVAMTGDGINDVPALRAAAVGLAMGEGGTDVARESAGIVLADNSFATLAAAIALGRGLFVKLQKGVRYYLAVKVALVVTMLVPAVLGFVPPLSAAMIILLEMFMDLAASTAMVGESAEGDLMAEPPRPPGQRFLDRNMLVAMGVGGLALAVAVWLGMWGAARSAAVPRAAAAPVLQSAAFAAWMVGHVALAFAMRRSRRSPWSRPFWANRMLNLWAAGAIATALIVVYLPPVQRLLQTSPLPIAAWWWVGAAPTAIMLVLGSIPGLFWYDR